MKSSRGFVLANKLVSRETSVPMFHVKPYQACLQAYDCASLIQDLKRAVSYLI